MLYYIHIPKTAGTSLRAFLRDKIYGSKMCEVYSDTRHWNSEQYMAIRDYEVFYGHFYFGFHWLLGDKNPSYVTVLRNPVERVISFYKHHKLNEQATYHRMIERENLSLRDFVEATSSETSNQMVRMLSSDHGQNVQIKSRRLLWEARKNIEQYFLFTGMTERLTEVAAFVSQFYGMKLDDVSLPWLNVLTLTGFSLDPTTRMAIESANELDLELYDGIGTRRC